MKPIIPSFLFSSLLLLILCSFSSLPTATVREEHSPVENKAENQRQKRLNKRYNRLHKRFDQAKNSKKRLHLQNKIRQVERQQDRAATPAVGIVGLALGVLAFMLFFAAALYFLPALAALAALTALGGLITSSVAVGLSRKFPERYSMKGFGVAGIILGSVILAFSFLFLLIGGFF